MSRSTIIKLISIPAVLAAADCILICVPTPLRKTREPDISAIVAAAPQIRRPLRRGQPLPQRSEPAKLDPSEFNTEIDNPYWPMTPGSKWTYKEVEDGQSQDVVVTVTDKTKRIAVKVAPIS